MPKGIFERKAGIKYGRPAGSKNKKPSQQVEYSTIKEEVEKNVAEQDKKEVSQ